MVTLLIALIISTLISSFCIFTFDMWRIRLQIYPVIKRFYVYYFHLLSQENIFKSNDNSGIQECFIDEFGWIVIIKGVTIDMIVSVSNQILYYFLFSPILLWKSKPIEYYNNTNDNINNNNNNNNNNENYYSTFKILYISIMIGCIIGIIQYIAQYYKIKLQFRLGEKLQPKHKDKKYNQFTNPIYCLNSSSILFYNKNKNHQHYNYKKKDDNFNELFENYKYNINLNQTEKIIKQQLIGNGNENVIINGIINKLYLIFGDSLISVFNESIYNFIFLLLFNYLNYFQITLNPITTDESNLFNYLINYIYYRSTLIPLFLSSVIAIITTQPFIVYQTQLEAFQFSNLLLNLFFKSPPFKQQQVNNNNNEQSSSLSRKDNDLISFPLKFKKIYLKNIWVGLIGRLLYSPLKIMIISIWFDFLLSL